MLRSIVLRSVSGLLGLTALAACAARPPATASVVDAPVIPVAGDAVRSGGGIEEPPPPPDAPRVDRFPGGPGVDLVYDDLQAVVRDRSLMDKTTPYDARLAGVRAKLGAPGEPRTDAQSGEGISFVAVGGKSSIAPWSCHELFLPQRGAPFLMRSTDHRRCGLPYADAPVKQYKGPAPYRTLTRLKEAFADVASLSTPAAQVAVRSKVGVADEVVGGESFWLGIGGRGHDAPVSCHVLSIGSRTEVVEAPLERCGFAWPPPQASFDPGADVPPIDKPAALADCAQRCGAQEICMIDQQTPWSAQVRAEADGQRARTPDGRAVKVDLVASCVPVPATCTTPSASCFFATYTPGQPPPAPGASIGPCPRATYGGYSFQTSPSPHILCFSRIGAPASLPILPPPPPHPGLIPPRPPLTLPRPALTPPPPLPPAPPPPHAPAPKPKPKTVAAPLSTGLIY